MSTILKSKTVWSAEDLAKLPDTERFELIEGDLAPMSPPGEEHGTASGNLHVFVGHHILTHNLGRIFTAETGFKLASDPDTVMAPDFAFVTKARCISAVSDQYAAIAPDLVLETRSPGDSISMTRRKIARWLSYGVQVVWDLDPKRAILVATYADGHIESFGLGDELTCDALLPGFTVPMRSIFPER
jgi:Uma2 family endonuclease